MARKVPDDVQKVFDRYTEGIARRLKRDRAIEMFKKEFELDDERSEMMFDMFDKDGNKILSMWEFYLFFQSLGYEAKEYLDKYNTLTENESSAMDIDGLWEFLKDLKTMKGRNFSDEELETMIKGVAGEQDRSIDKKKFIEVISRIKLTRH